MMPNSKLLPALSLLGVPVMNLLFKNIHPPANTAQDLNPSKFLSYLAMLAVVAEVSLGPLNMVAPVVGVPLATMFHVYILSMTPFASVMEWNCMCLYLIYALYDQTAVGFAGYGGLSAILHDFMAVPFLLQVFLALVLFAIPIFGQIYPRKVPFLLAFRPYAGNWRFTWHIVSKKAIHKVRKLKTLEGPFVSENARMLWGSIPAFCEQFEAYFLGNLIFFPHFRPIVPMVEKLMEFKRWATDDFEYLFNETFLNAIMGWTLGTGFYVNGAYFDAVSSTCGFQRGECFVAIFEPLGLHERDCEWSLVDITEPSIKLMRGKHSYTELEQLQPAGMPLHMFEKSTKFAFDKSK